MTGPGDFSWPNGAKAAVSISFDDARASQVDRGLEVLDFYGFKATFFVQPGNMKGKLEEWRKATAEGHEMGNHTVSHPCSANFPWARENALEDWTLERMEAELLEANRLVKEALGVVPRTFGYPCGQTFVGRGAGVRSYVPLVAKHFLAGRAFLSEYLNDPAVCDPAQLGAAALDGLSSGDAITMVDEAKRTGAWVIFCGHDVGDKGFQVTKVPTLEKFCEWLRAPSSGAWVTTVAGGAGHLARMHSAGKGG